MWIIAIDGSVKPGNPVAGWAVFASNGQKTWDLFGQIRGSSTIAEMKALEIALDNLPPGKVLIITDHLFSYNLLNKMVRKKCYNPLVLKWIKLKKERGDDLNINWVRNNTNIHQNQAHSLAQCAQSGIF